MSPDFIFYSGIVILSLSVLGGIITAVVLRVVRTRLNKQLDAEYGKRRH